MGEQYKETLRPILRRACWSLNLSLQGRRPTLSQALECGFELNRKSKQQAGTKLAVRFATAQFLGDWQWHVYLWALFNHYWKCGAICFRCPAARIPRRLGQNCWRIIGFKHDQRRTIVDSFWFPIVPARFGHLFTDIDFDWEQTLRTTAQFVQQCLVVGPPNPLKDLLGLDVSMLSLTSRLADFLTSQFSISTSDAVVLFSSWWFHYNLDRNGTCMDIAYSYFPPLSKETLYDAYLEPWNLSHSKRRGIADAGCSQGIPVPLQFGWSIEPPLWWLQGLAHCKSHNMFPATVVLQTITSWVWRGSHLPMATFKGI